MTTALIVLICLSAISAGLGVAQLLFFRYHSKTVVRDVAQDLADHEARCVERYKETRDDLVTLVQPLTERVESIEIWQSKIEKALSRRKRDLNG